MSDIIQYDELIVATTKPMYSVLTKLYCKQKNESILSYLSALLFLYVLKRL